MYENDERDPRSHGELLRDKVSFVYQSPRRAEGNGRTLSVSSDRSGSRASAAAGCCSPGRAGSFDRRPEMIVENTGNLAARSDTMRCDKGSRSCSEASEGSLDWDTKSSDTLAVGWLGRAAPDKDLVRRLADGTLMSCRADRDSRGRCSKRLQKLNKGNSHQLIFNTIKMSTHGSCKVPSVVCMLH